MAMLDPTAMLGSYLAGKTPEAKQNEKFLTIAFSKEVDEVATGGVDKYISGSAAASAAEAAQSLTPEEAQHAKDTLKELMDAKKDWAIAQYKS